MKNRKTASKLLKIEKFSNYEINEDDKETSFLLTFDEKDYFHFYKSEIEGHKIENVEYIDSKSQIRIKDLVDSSVNGKQARTSFTHNEKYLFQFFFDNERMVIFKI
jgi:hypothetical protein